MSRRSAIPVEVRVHSENRYPATVEVAAYYVVSEALTNSIRHAAASQVDVVVEETAAHTAGVGPRRRRRRSGPTAGIGLDRLARQDRGTQRVHRGHQPRRRRHDHRGFPTNRAARGRWHEEFSRRAERQRLTAGGRAAARSCFIIACGPAYPSAPIRVNIGGSTASTDMNSGKRRDTGQEGLGCSAAASFPASRKPKTTAVRHVALVSTVQTSVWCRRTLVVHARGPSRESQVPT